MFDINNIVSYNYIVSFIYLCLMLTVNYMGYKLFMNELLIKSYFIVFFFL